MRKKRFLIAVVVLMMVMATAVLSACSTLNPSDYNEGINIDVREFKESKDERKYANAPEYKGFIYRKADKLMTFRFKKPSATEDGKNYPLVIFLHGSGDWGYDNEGQMYKSLINSVAKYGEECFVFIPQTNKNHNWTDTDGDSEIYNDILDNYILKNYPIDLNRVYLTGMSMGGNGTFYQADKYPEKYAAAMPLCGYTTTENFDNLVNMPMWIAHSKDDTAVDFSCSVYAYNKLIEIGNTKVKNTWYESEGHQITQIFYDNQEVWSWLFAQKKA